MIERTILHHDHDDMVDLREVVSGPRIAERGRSQLPYVRAEPHHRAADDADVIGISLRIRLDGRDIIDHDRIVLYSHRFQREVAAEQHGHDFRRAENRIFYDVAKAVDDLVVDLALDVRGQPLDAERDKAAGQDSQGDRRLPSDIDVDRIVGDPRSQDDRARAVNIDADFECQKLVLERQ